MDNSTMEVADILGCRNGLSRKALVALQKSVALKGIDRPMAFPNAKALTLHVSARVASDLRKVLDFTISDVLAAGWTSYKELQKYADPAEYEPGETITATLGDHSIEYSKHPSIELTVNGKSVGTLTFELQLAAKVDMVILTFRDGKLMSAEAAQCAISGELKLADAVLAERKLADFKIPGIITFGQGIPIRSRPVTSSASSSP